MSSCFPLLFYRCLFVYLHNKKNITRRLEDMNFIFSWQKQYFTHSLRSLVKYSFATRNKIHIFVPPCNILCPCRVSPFLAWGDFHARSRFARSTIPEEKWGTTRSLLEVHMNSFKHWNLEVLVFEGRGKPEYPEKNLSEQWREPTTNSTHIWRQRRELKTRATLVGGERSHHYATLGCV